ncbi:MAG: dTDP-glucose 4,6-dehydratase [Nitrospiraceae bacterium]|nr:dTDP-glucose 4,6-dehydratase [Nitrospiraceae bacterium]
MNILVTGGAGFIGSNFIRHILSAHPGYRIINLDKLTYAGNLENLSDVENNPGYRFIRGDIGDRELVEGIEFDAVINFAAESHVDRSILDASPFLQTNVIGTQSLLEVVRKRNCRFVHISTDEVYGSTPEGLFTEESPLMPNSPYAASKASSDLLVRAYHETYGIEAIITRCSNNYGPFQFPEKLIPLVIANALEGRPVPVYGDGRNVRDWIHVLDHCRAVDLVFHRGRPGEVYNIGGSNEWFNIDLVRLLLATIARRTGRAEAGVLGLIAFVEDRAGHDRRYAINASKISRELGWRPETGFEEGLAATVAWYLANREWWARIISGQYMEYYKVQYGQRLV